MHSIFIIIITIFATQSVCAVCSAETGEGEGGSNFGD